MGYIAKGLYRELLDEAWIEGSLPADMQSLAEICGCPVEVLIQAWPEVAPCFEEHEGRLFNAKLENQRTEKDAERVKKANAGRSGAIAKMALANARQPQASASNCLEASGNCHIEEKRREEKSKEEQKPSRRQAASDPKKHSDVRYEPCKDLVFAAYRHKNNIDPPWEGREGQALAMLLRSWPQLRVEDFRRALGHWARSEVAHSDRPGIWIPKLSSFLGAPIDRFNKPFASERPAKEGYGMDPRNEVKSTRAEYEEWLAMPEDYRQKHRWVFEIPEAK